MVDEGGAFDVFGAVRVDGAGVEEVFGRVLPLGTAGVGGLGLGVIEVAGVGRGGYVDVIVAPGGVGDVVGVRVRLPVLDGVLDFRGLLRGIGIGLYGVILVSGEGPIEGCRLFLLSIVFLYLILCCRLIGFFAGEWIVGGRVAVAVLGEGAAEGIAS